MKFIRRGSLWLPSKEPVTPHPALPPAEHANAAEETLLDRVLAWLSGDRTYGQGTSPLISGEGDIDYGLTPDDPVLWLSPEDPYWLDELFEHIIVLGEPGSGKTSGSGQTFAQIFLRAGFGGLVLCHKSDESRHWIKMAEEAGRRDSLIVVNPRNPWRFNFLNWQFSRAGEGAGYVENAVELLMEILENRRGRQRVTRDDFWPEGARRMLRHSMLALIASGHPVTMDGVVRVIRTAPTPGTAGAQWRDGSFLRSCIEQARQRERATGIPTAIGEVEDYFAHEFAFRGSERGQTAAVISTFMNMADSFTASSSPLKELFCTETNYTPAWCRRGAIIIVDLPILEYHHIGKTAAVLMKALFQAEMLRRQGLEERGERPVFLYADESQQFFLPNFDARFLEAARSSWVSVCYLTQNLSNWYAVAEKREQADAIIGNFGLKVFHRNGDQNTNHWASETIGKEVLWRRNGSISISVGQSEGEDTGGGVTHGGDQGSISINYGENYGRSVTESRSVGGSEVFDYPVPPATFTRLKNGGRRNHYEVQAVVFKAGRTFSTTGRPYRGVSFPQRSVR